MTRLVDGMKLFELFEKYMAEKVEYRERLVLRERDEAKQRQDIAFAATSVSEDDKMKLNAQVEVLQKAATAAVLDRNSVENPRIRAHRTAGLEATENATNADQLILAMSIYPYEEVQSAIARKAEALPALRRATALSNHNPLIATTFGHALIATEDPGQLAEAEKVLRAAVALDRENPFAWYQLGMIYGAKGDLPRAQLASAEQQTLQRNYPQALRSAETAQAGLAKGSPDWIRAGDIAMQSRAAIEQGRKRR